jgi:NADH-quinone oxidoreductase subunit G
MRRERPQATLVVDGVEVISAEGAMLVDAAKLCDVEIPVFCYEPKLGEPVGACRMCLVEIEGIPKLQTACSTPVRDGMVAYTQTDRVKEAQRAVVEFLLVNHPLDCPVCDKGGECPLQDIAMGWGPDRSRFVDPKRHFQKPIPLSPLVKIDRERCILCYRCVRFSQEVAEDEQLQLLDRGAATYVGTFDDRPYIAPFHGNVIELCPVGALTSEAYRFRARPWEIEDAGTICTLCPSQCNVRLTVRDERIQRVLARDHPAVDDGWLCDKGRFGFQMIESPERIVEPLVRDGGDLRPAAWTDALDAAAAGLRDAGDRAAAIVGGSCSNEEGYLAQRIIRRALGSPHVDSRAGGAADRNLLLELSRPDLSASVSDLDVADAVLVVGCDPLHAMPILDLRIRKVVRRNGARLAVATDRPSALDSVAEETANYAPGEAASLLAALAAELGDAEPDAPRTDAYREAVARIAGELRPGSTVIVWGERVGRGPTGEAALGALVACARALRLDAGDGAGLLEIPEGTNARGLREVGCVAGLGLSEADGGSDAGAIRDGLAAVELDALMLVEADPVRDHPGGPAWDAALGEARFVLVVSMFENASTRHADVVFPAESYAEKEGTVTHPDGRLQRLRPGVPHPGRVRPTWQVLAELCALLGEETGIDSAPEALEAIAREVPFYAGLTHEEIGGRGVRWQERDAAGAFDSGDAEGGRGGVVDAAGTHSVPGRVPLGTGPRSPTPPRPPIAGDRGLTLGTYRDLWAAEVTERSPALRFLSPKQTLELAPADAERLGVASGDGVEVRSNGARVGARVAVRERIRPGAGFLIEGTAEENANALSWAETVSVTQVEVEE